MNVPQDRAGFVRAAFLQAAAKESQKTTQERILEQTGAPFYFIKGAAKASLKLLEKGIQNKISSWQEQLEMLQSPKKNLVTQAKKQEALRNAAKTIYQNPRKFLAQISEGFKDEVTRKTVEFLISPKKKQAEWAGEWAPSLALAFAGGRLGSLTRISKEMNLSVGIGGNDFPTIAKRIANGHAFEKHVLKGNEFPKIKAKQDLAKLIEKILEKPGEVKSLADGRFAFWDEASKTVLIINPKTIDGGTIFVPKKGKTYFNEILE